MLATIVLVAGLGACLLACLRADRLGGLVAIEVASVVAVLALVTMTMAFKRQPFIDLAVVLAPVSLAGSLAFVRHLESGG